MLSSKAQQVAQTRNLKKRTAKLGLLEGSEEGCAERLGDLDGEQARRGSIDGSNGGPELVGTAQTRPARRPGRGFCGETLYDTAGELYGSAEHGPSEGPGGGKMLKLGWIEATKRAVSKHGVARKLG